MKYKVFFHRGDELTLKTRVMKGQAQLDDSGLHIEGSGGFDIPLSELQEAELFRLHGLGQFALINFFKTGALHKELVAVTANKS
jgi:hypothetical protein